MRDDLHRTVPLPRPWGRVLRCLSSERWTAEELAPLIAATVQQDLNPAGAPSGGVISLALSQVGGDLFDNGAEKLRLTLQSLQDGPLSVMERATCEAALGILSTRGLTENFAAEVAQAVGFAHARDSVEHMLNRVAVVHGRDQAAQARQVLNSAIALCDFAIPAQSTPSRPRKSVDHLLDTELPLGA